MFLPCRLDTSCALLLLALAASSSTAQSLLLAAAVTPSPARQNRRMISDRQAYQHLSKVLKYPVKFKSGRGILTKNLVRILTSQTCTWCRTLPPTSQSRPPCPPCPPGHWHAGTSDRRTPLRRRYHLNSAASLRFDQVWFFTRVWCT